MERIKRLVFLSAIVVALVMSSCCCEKHKKYIPADSKVLGKIDIKAFFEQTGADHKKLMKDIEEYLGNDDASIKDMGIDVKVPIYIFGHGKGEEYSFGIVVKVSDKDKVRKWLNKRKDETGLKIKEGDDFDYGVHGDVAIGLNKDALVFISVIGDGKFAEKEIKKIMKKEYEGDLDDNELFKKVKESKSFACLYADLSIIPDDVVKQAEKEAPEIKERLSDLRKMMVGIDGTFDDGICDFEVWAQSDDKKVQEKIDKIRNIYKTPTDKAVSTLPEEAIAGIATNVDGEKLSEYIEANVKDIGLINQFSEEEQIIFENLLSVLANVKGDLAGYFAIPDDLIAAVETKGDITRDIAELLLRITAASESPGLMEGDDDNYAAANDSVAVNSQEIAQTPENIAQDDVDYSSGFGCFSPYIKETNNGYVIKDKLWIGYNNGAIYFANNKYLTTSAFEKADTTIPSYLSSFIKSRRFVMFFNVDKVLSYSVVFGDKAKKQLNAYAQVVEKIKYVTISMR